MHGIFGAGLTLRVGLEICAGHFDYVGVCTGWRFYEKKWEGGGMNVILGVRIEVFNDTERGY